METLGERLKRKRGKLSQREVARRADVSDATVCMIETGAIENPRWKILGRIERALGMGHGSLTRGLDLR